MGSSGTPVLYIGCVVIKGWNIIEQAVVYLNLVYVFTVGYEGTCIEIRMQDEFTV